MRGKINFLRVKYRIHSTAQAIIFNNPLVCSDSFIQSPRWQHHTCHNTVCGRNIVQLHCSVCHLRSHVGITGSILQCFHTVVYFCSVESIQLSRIPNAHHLVLCNHIDFLGDVVHLFLTDTTLNTDKKSTGQPQQDNDDCNSYQQLCHGKSIFSVFTSVQIKSHFLTH